MECLLAGVQQRHCLKLVDNRVMMGGAKPEAYELVADFDDGGFYADMPEGYRLLLPEDRFPVQAFFNIWPEDEFLQMVSRMASGVESSYNDVGWSWSGGEPDQHVPCGHVLFFYRDEETIVTIEEALAYLEQAIEAYLMVRPVDAKQASLLLQAAKGRLFSL